MAMEERGVTEHAGKGGGGEQRRDYRKKMVCVISLVQTSNMAKMWVQRFKEIFNKWLKSVFFIV